MLYLVFYYASQNSPGGSYILSLLSEMVVFGSDGLETATSSLVGCFLTEGLALRLLPFELIDYLLLFIVGYFAVVDLLFSGLSENLGNANIFSIDCNAPIVFHKLAAYDTTCLRKAY
jgi:hypothetical protein